jgi:hypothetical protein
MLCATTYPPKMLLLWAEKIQAVVSGKSSQGASGQ